MKLQHKQSELSSALTHRTHTSSSCESAADVLTCLRNVDFDTLQAANMNITSSAFFGTFDSIPVVDGTFITQRPSLSLEQRKVNGVSVLSPY